MAAFHLWIKPVSSRKRPISAFSVFCNSHVKEGFARVCLILGLSRFRTTGLDGWSGIPSRTDSRLDLAITRKGWPMPLHLARHHATRSLGSCGARSSKSLTGWLRQFSEIGDVGAEVAAFSWTMQPGVRRTVSRQMGIIFSRLNAGCDGLRTHLRAPVKFGTCPLASAPSAKKLQKKVVKPGRFY